jgi:hypothetical protein
MQYASDMVDVSVDDIVGSMKKMKKNMDSDSKDVQAAWDQLGVSVKDATTGEMRPAIDVFYDAIGALSQVENETERDQLAMDLFGKSADNLAGLIDDGGEAFRGYGQQAEDMGLILSGDTLNSINQVNDKIDETKLDYNTDGYAFFPLAYYKLNIRIDWSKKKPKILKYRDGEGRRKRLYIDTIMIRAIKPDVSFLELLYNLVFRRQYFYDNSDKVLTNKILIDDVRTILKMKMDDIYALNSSKHGAFKTDAVYCAEHGISRRQHSRTVRKMLNYQCIGEWYDVSKSVNQNYKYAQTQKIKVSLNTLKNFCVENDIDMYPNKKPISEWYDVQLSVK